MIVPRVERTTNGTAEFVEDVEFPHQFFELVAFSLEQLFLLAELLVGFLQLLIGLLQIA